jgi:hypothetical protein
MTAPVSSWVRVTVAPGAAAPVGSVTVPANVAVVTCARPVPVKTNRLASKINPKNLPDVHGIPVLGDAIKRADENEQILDSSFINSSPPKRRSKAIDGRFYDAWLDPTLPLVSVELATAVV